MNRFLVAAFSAAILLCCAHICSSYRLTGHGGDLARQAILDARASRSLSHKSHTTQRALTTTRTGSLSRLHLFGDFLRVLRGKVHGFLRSLEDPETLLDEALREMERDLTRVRQSYAEIAAAVKRAERELAAGDALMKDWYARAQRAMSGGEEELAKQALAERERQRKLNSAVSQQLRTQREAQEKLRAALTTLEGKIAQAQREKDAFVARAKTARVSLEVNEMLDSLTQTSSTSAVDAFARMRDKVEALEIQAEVGAEAVRTQGPSALRLQLDEKDADAELERELALLKSGTANSVSAVREGAIETNALQLEDGKTEDGVDPLLKRYQQLMMK